MPLRPRWMHCFVIALAMASSARAEPPTADDESAATVGEIRRVTARIRVRRPVLRVDDDAAHEQNIRTQLDILRGPVTINGALRRPGISSLPTIVREDDPFGWLSAALETTSNKESEVVTIHLRGDRPDDLQAILQAVLDVYFADMLKKDQVERLARRAALAKQYEELDAERRRKEKAYAEASGDGDGMDENMRRRLLLGEIGSLRTQRTRVLMDKRSVEVDIGVAEAVGDTPDPRHVAKASILAEHCDRLDAAIAEAVSGVRAAARNQGTLVGLREELGRISRETAVLKKTLDSEELTPAPPPNVMLLEAPSVDEAR